MEVVVQLKGSAAAKFRAGQTADPDVARLQGVLRELGLNLLPQHPGVDDSALSRYFVGEVRDREDGLRAIAALTALQVVTSAYAKPPAQSP